MSDALDHGEGMCQHGLAGFCPDCPPRGHTIGEIRGARSARVKGGKLVERVREDGSLDWYTTHLTKRGARRAAALYERTGKVRGMRP